MFDQSVQSNPLIWPKNAVERILYQWVGCSLLHLYCILPVSFAKLGSEHTQPKAYVAEISLAFFVQDKEPEANNKPLHINETMSHLIVVKTHLWLLLFQITIDAKHFCVKSRGVEDTECSTVTSRLGGSFKAQPEVRAEFLALLK